MNETNTLILILIYGSLILLSFLLIVNPLKVNKKANFWFGIFLFLWSSFWLEEISAMAGINPLDGVSLISVRFFQFLTPIVFYFCVIYYSNPGFKFKKTHLVYIVLPIIYFVGLIAQQQYQENTLLAPSLNILIVIQALYFTGYSYVNIQHHKKRIRLFSSNTSEIDLKWLEYIIVALIVLSVFIAVYNAMFEGAHLNLLANMVSLIIVFFVAYNTLKQKEIFLMNENQRDLIIKTEEQTVIEKRKIISDEDLEILKPKLMGLMENQKPYLDPELTLVRLAELIEITPHQLSYLINAGFNENFFWFVNRYRVQRVKELLLDKKNNHMTILGIAYESGFSSKTSFNTAFKKITAQTPSEYKKSSSPL